MTSKKNVRRPRSSDGRSNAVLGASPKCPEICWAPVKMMGANDGRPAITVIKVLYPQKVMKYPIKQNSYQFFIPKHVYNFLSLLKMNF